MREMPLVLKLDIAGNPNCWIPYQRSVYYYAKDRVAWEAAPATFNVYGGKSRLTGEQSVMTINTIIAVRPEGGLTDRQLRDVNRVSLSNPTLFRRDKHICAYCGREYSPGALSRDHVIPRSQGGANTWMNVVTACHGCNKYKDNKTSEEAGLQLLYLPYTPNRAEYLILKNRKILADQMEFLMARVPAQSRLL